MLPDPMITMKYQDYEWCTKQPVHLVEQIYTLLDRGIQDCCRPDRRGLEHLSPTSLCPGLTLCCRTCDEATGALVVRWWDKLELEELARTPGS